MIRREDPTAALHAPLGRVLWHACAQTTFSVAVYGVYGLTNAWFVSRGAGEDALAAVMLATPVLLLLGAVSTTVGVGGASLVSRALGAGRPRDAARAAGTAMTVFWAAAVLTTVFGLMFLDPILRLLGATDAILPDARTYATILLLGSVVSTGFSAIVRAEGRLFFSMLLWLVPVAVQIVLDPLLIFGAGLGVAGAALGTVGGQAVSAVMALWFFFVRSDRAYPMTWRDLRPRASTARTVLGIGAPSFLLGFGATVLQAVGNATLAAFPAGLMLLAASGVAARVQQFAVMPHTGIAQGMQPVVGMNAGARATARVAGALRLSLAGSLGYGAIAALVMALFAQPIAGAFVDDATTAQTAAQAIRVLAIGVVVSGIPGVVAAYVQAIGRPTPAYVLTLGTLFLVRLPLMLLAGAGGDPMRVWVALAVGDLISAAVAAALLWWFSRVGDGVSRSRR